MEGCFDRSAPRIRNFIIENEVPDLGHGRVGCWVPCLDEVVGFVFGFTFLVLYVGHPITCSIYIKPSPPKLMGLDGPEFCDNLVFTVVGTLWSLVFSRCSVYLLNLHFVFSFVVDSAHRLSSLHYKVATQILGHLCFTMFSYF